MSKLENIGHILDLKKRASENKLFKQRAIVQSLQREIEGVVHEIAMTSTSDPKNIDEGLNIGAIINQCRWAGGLRDKKQSLQNALETAELKFLSLRKELSDINGKSNLVALQIKRQQALSRQKLESAEEDRRSQNSRQYQI